ncbi:MAG: carbohydrate binding family 9 domain-containing protein [Bacteroidetes bacterium]|nr:carbohydrate binding family 9 domain-containing protein [Bacteroidota bacterium]
MQKLLCCLFLLLVFSQSKAQILSRKTYTIQYSETTPKIDGILDEALWNTAQNATHFTQTIPSPDQPSNFETEVKMVYGSKSIFVGAILHQSKKELSKLLTARDETNNINADVFSVFFDTYDDHQNGYAFRVTAAGVQQDERLSGGDQYGDVSWDAVWISKVKMNDQGWCVEMEIPFSAIRFTTGDQMKWGVNFFRLQRKKNENSYWNPINVQQSGFLAQTALLDGFQKMKPPVRLFLFPYLSLGYSENPYADKLGKQWLKSGGLDLKYGLSESFTLDLTLVPDFSQVISDNLVRNLLPFEQQLSENRPFFTEGVDLFAKADLFYSRRIGSRPNGFYEVESTYSDTTQYSIQKNPNVSTLYNAFKITGRTARNNGIGIFNSLAKPMYATVNDKINNKTFKVETAPLTNHNILVFDKPLKGQSFIHFANTNVIRMGKARDANVSAVTFNLYDKKEAHLFSGYAKASVVNNNQLDAGTSFGLNYQKVSGKFRYGILANTMSPQFDKTDMGLQFDFNRTSQNIGISYNENKPKQAFLQLYEISSNHDFQWNTLPFAFRSYQANANLFLLFKNFWDVSLSFETKPFAPTDYYQLGSFDKKLIYLPYFYSAIGGSSDSGKNYFGTITQTMVFPI